MIMVVITVTVNSDLYFSSGSQLSGLGGASNGVDPPKPKRARTQPLPIATLKAAHSPVNPESWVILSFLWQSAQVATGQL